jgi:aconitase A
LSISQKTNGCFFIKIGATTSVFPYTKSMEAYLRATGRSHVADAANHINQTHGYLRADDGAENLYDRVIEMNLSELEPHINGMLP